MPRESATGRTATGITSGPERCCPCRPSRAHRCNGEGLGLVSAARPPVPAPGAAVPAQRFAPGSLLRAGLLVAPLMAVGNGLNYVYNVVMARLLGPAGYGALGALLALALIASVPGLALQVVVARHTALRVRDQHALAELWTATLAGVVGAGLALGALVAAASPLLAAYLRLGSAAPALWLAASVAPLPALAAVQGMLQGRERFAALAWVLLAAAAGKLAAGVGLVALGAGVEGAIAAVSLGSLAAVLLAVVWVRPGLAGPPSPGRGRSWMRPLPRGLGREVAGATTAILGLFVLANVDVLLARHHLAADASGLYAAGAVVAKIAYWAPQVVVLMVFPRLVTSGARRRLLARSAACVAGFGALLVVAAAAAPHLAASVSFGRSYLAVGPALPLFAALGTCLALVQLVLFSGIASADARLTWLLVAAVGVEVAVVTTVLHGSVTEIVTVTLTVAAALLVAGWLLERGRVAPGGGRVEGAAP
jgi:O-antigen/teichoic acid export membrane protein